MDNRSDIWRGIDAIKARFVDLSDKVWAKVAPQFDGRQPAFLTTLHL